MLVVLLNTQVGLALRATGDNLAMGEANGIKVDRMKILGYMISNGLIALSGALLAQNNGYADMNMGTGTIVNGLAAIILAEVIVKHSTTWQTPLVNCRRSCSLPFGLGYYPCHER